MNYTKGEWFVRESGLEDGEHEFEVAYEFKAENGFILDYPIADIHDKLETGTGEANAHLIAASPRLYQQLVRANELIKWLDAKYRLSQDIDTSDNIDLVVTGNKEALAKAEGREE